MKRTDCHKPSSINPEDYEYVAQEFYPRDHFEMLSPLVESERARIRAHMERTGGDYSRHEHGGNCMVCGNANAIYTVLFYHAKSNTYVRMGQDCAEKCDMGDAGAFRAFKQGVDDFNMLQKGKRKAEAILRADGLERAWAIYNVESKLKYGRPYAEEAIDDIVSKLIRYGSISDNATKLIRTLLEKIDGRAEAEAKRKMEKEAAAPCPSGRVKITGEIVSVKDVETDFGTTTKIVVKTPDGWCCYGTMPAGLGVNMGDSVEFTATLAPSDKDPKFGFYKRPAKAKALSGKYAVPFEQQMQEWATSTK